MIWAVYTLASAPASPSRNSSSWWRRSALPRLLAETTTALIADSLRFILEFSPAGCALDHAVLHRATLPLRP